MHKAPKVHRLIPENVDRDALRAMQMQAGQDLLFTMAELGDTHAGFQMEIEGVLQCIVVSRTSQAEFDEIISRLSASAAGEAGAPRS